MIAQRNEHPELTCGHPARLKILYDVSGRFSIPVFTEKPLRKDVNETDFLGTFMSQPTEESEPLHEEIFKGHHKRDVKGAMCKHMTNALQKLQPIGT